MSGTRSEQLLGDLRQLAAGRLHWAERFAAEIELAEGLKRLLGRGSAWRKRIDQACQTVGKVVGAGKLDRLGGAVRDAEETLAPIGKAAKRYTVHCVAHAHIDMNWMWSWPETVAVTNDTFTTVLRLMEEFDDFCFTQSQASVYEIARKYLPEVFEQVRRRVAEGRWEVVAPLWVEADKNLSSGESLARHLLYTRRFFAEQFDLAPEDVPLDWSPDTFGHAHTIPAVLVRGAVKFAYMCRPGGREDKPPVFWWQAPDGSRVLVNLEQTWYNDRIGPHNVEAMLAFCEKTHLRDWMNVYGVGDHGGGPTRRDLLRARDMDAWPIYPRFRFATTKDYYRLLERHADDWPVLDRELNYEFTGCYTSQSQIKLGNRLGESQGVEAEAAAALAWRLLGRAYPHALLREAWVNTIFGHFHDILPGSGVRATRQYQLGLFQDAAAASGAIKTNALRGVAGEVDTQFAGGPPQAAAPGRESVAFGGGAGRGTQLGGLSAAGHVADGPRPFVIFNPIDANRSEVVQVTLWDTDTGGDLHAKQFVVHGPEGAAVPAQQIGTGNYWGHKYVDLAFPAAVPAMGYRGYAATEGVAPDHEPVARCGSGFRGGERQPFGATVLENDLLYVEFDHTTGGIVKLVDKASGRDLADPAHPAGVLEYLVERPRGMTAWILNDARSRVCPVELVSFDPSGRGPHLASMVARARINDSEITVTYALKAHQPWLDIAIEAQWLERGSRQIGTPTLRMQFPLALSGAKARYEVPFGSVRRELSAGEEVPALRWADVTGRQGSAAAGCALLNDCKYGHSLDGSTLRLTLIRSSYEPDPLPEMGAHTVRLALVPHGGKLSAAALVRLAAALNHPLLPVATDVHAGPLPAEGMSAAACRPANVVLSSMKKAEDEDALIIRLYETAGRAADAKVALAPELLGTAAEAVEVDLLERPLAESTARITDEGFRVRVGARGIASVKLTFDER